MKIQVPTRARKKLQQEDRNNSFTQSQTEDLRLAASKMSGAKRRAFQAQICRKYCGGNARDAEAVFGWGRKNVQVGKKKLEVE